VRILVIDIEGQFLDFVLRCTAAGHECRWYKHVDKGSRQTRDGEGFKGFKVVDEWQSSMPWAKDGLIICSGNYVFMHELDRYRDHGFKIFAPTVKSAELEIKRDKGMDVMRSLGFDLPAFTMFDSLEDAEKFARKSDISYCFKSQGDEGNKDMTYVSCDPADMVGWLRDKINRGMVLKSPCMLQEKIDMLCDYGVSGWFGPEGFLPDKFQICFEHKRLGNDEVGPQTGEMGSVTQYCVDEKLAQEYLRPMAPVLQALGHRGDFAIGVGIDKKGKVWPFEFTARCGFPAWHIQNASHKGDPAQWMRDLLDGKDTLKVSRDVAIDVVMAQPPFPFNPGTAEQVEGNVISGVEDVWDDAHLCQVMLGKGPKMEDGKIVERPTCLTTGNYVLVATGLGKTITKARKSVYDTVRSIKFPSAMYRTDIGEKIEKILPDLHRFGFCPDLEYE
jgi:phosphoribosylamine---glycine ligase